MRLLDEYDLRRRLRSRRYGAYELHASVREAPTPGAVARCNDNSCDDDTEDDDDTHEFSHVIILCVVWFTGDAVLLTAAVGAVIAREAALYARLVRGAAVRGAPPLVARGVVEALAVGL